MFDIGWSEMAVIALIALLVIGPKDLPGTMKTVAHWMRKARSLTREFQSGIDEMVRDAELQDAKKALEATRSGNLQKTIGNAIDPGGELDSEVRDVERQAQRSDDESDKGGDGNAGRAAAKMVSHPANVAPPHSLTPPADGGTSESGSAGSGDATTSSSGKEGSKQAV